jgi:septum formation protein
MLEEEGSKKIILASASPRRRKILRLLKLDFEVIEHGVFKEVKFKDPYAMAVQNSIIKARSVYNFLKEKNFKKGGPVYPEGFLIAGFDTVVYTGNEILGKPADKEQAATFLNVLSGRVHKVISGICIFDSVSGRYSSDTETTEVKFRKLTVDEVKSYLKRENVLDKAGAYNVLGYGSILVEKIDGCFYNIAGLPVAKFVDMLRESGFNVMS